MINWDKWTKLSQSKNEIKSVDLSWKLWGKCDGYIVFDDLDRPVHANCAFFSRKYEITDYGTMKFKCIDPHLDQILDYKNEYSCSICNNDKGHMKKWNNLKWSEYFHINCMIFNRKEYIAYADNKIFLTEKYKEICQRVCKLYFSNKKGALINDSNHEFTKELNTNPNLYFYCGLMHSKIKLYWCWTAYDIKNELKRVNYRSPKKDLDNPYIKSVACDFCFDWNHSICVGKLIENTENDYSSYVWPSWVSVYKAYNFMRFWIPDYDKTKHPWDFSFEKILKNGKFVFEILPLCSQNQNNMLEITFIGLLTLQELWWKVVDLVKENTINASLISYLLDTINCIPYHNTLIQDSIKFLKQRYSKYEEINKDISIWLMNEDMLNTILETRIDSNGNAKGIDPNIDYTIQEYSNWINKFYQNRLWSNETIEAESLIRIHKLLNEAKDIITGDKKKQVIIV